MGFAKIVGPSCYVLGMLIDRVAALQSALDGLLSEDLVGLGRDELLAGLSAF